MRKIRNYKFDQNLLPKEGWVYWKSKDGVKYSGPDGKIQNHREPWMFVPNGERRNNGYLISSGIYAIRYPYGKKGNRDKFFVNAGQKTEAVYVKYHKQQKLLQIAIARYNTKRNVSSRSWEISGDSVFLDVTTKQLYDYMGRKLVDCYTYDIDDKANISCLRFGTRSFYSCRQFIYGIFRNFTVYNYEQIIVAIGDRFLNNSGTFFPIITEYDFAHWWSTKNPQRKKNKNQKVVDDLSRIQLDDFDAEDFDSHVAILKSQQDYPTYVGCQTSFCGIWYQHVSDNLDVVRMSLKNQKMEEIYRMYIYKNKEYACVWNGSEWVSCQVNMLNSWRVTLFLYKDEKLKSLFYQNRALDKFYESQEQYQCSTRLYDTLLRYRRLVLMRKHAIIEQCLNLSLYNIAARMFSCESVNHTIGRIFGKINPKEKSLKKITGLSIEKLRHINEHMGDSRNATPITDMRKYCNVRSLDFETFKKVYCFEEEWFSQNGEYVFELNQRFDITMSMTNVLHFMHLTEINDDFPQIYKDTRQMYYRIHENSRPGNVDWLKEDNYYYSNLHDQLIEIRREEERTWRLNWQQREEERNKQIERNLKKIDENRKEYEYEDENYIIRLPKKLKELTEEGNVQRICIGGYRETHGSGSTNIFFLRRKCDPDKPFYAIEMNNYKKIVQIHGFGNKWLGNNPEAIPTVLRWLKKHQIECKREILLCTSEGYCANNNYVEMPTI